MGFRARASKGSVINNQSRLSVGVLERVFDAKMLHTCFAGTRRRYYGVLLLHYPDRVRRHVRQASFHPEPGVSVCFVVYPGRKH